MKQKTYTIIMSIIFTLVFVTIALWLTARLYNPKPIQSVSEAPEKPDITLRLYNYPDDTKSTLRTIPGRDIIKVEENGIWVRENTLAGRCFYHKFFIVDFDHWKESIEK